jgi:xanthine/uracil permease
VVANSINAESTVATAADFTRLGIDARVDFSAHKNLVIAGASLIAATGLGIKGLTVAGVNIAGIAFGTVLALLLNLCFSFGGEDGEGQGIVTK